MILIENARVHILRSIMATQTEVRLEQKLD